MLDNAVALIPAVPAMYHGPDEAVARSTRKPLSLLLSSVQTRFTWEELTVVAVSPRGGLGAAPAMEKTEHREKKRAKPSRRVGLNRATFLASFWPPAPLKPGWDPSPATLKCG